jgi:hypothetical protein
LQYSSEYEQFSKKNPKNLKPIYVDKLWITYWADAPGARCPMNTNNCSYPFRKKPQAKLGFSPRVKLSPVRAPVFSKGIEALF